jgi:ubiquinone/menaquinone biosynthesis C-methylase UbiE
MRFDTDTAALACRQELNTGGELYSLDDWIVQHARPAVGMRVLDLGCGKGKQTFRLAREVAPRGSVLALDASLDAVDEVNRVAQHAAQPVVRAILASFDDCIPALPTGGFDLIHSAYAIYYSSDMLALVQNLNILLAPCGSVFVCGPGKGTNAELLHIVNDALPGDGDQVKAVDDFMSKTEVSRIAQTYREIETVRLHNSIRFGSASAVMAWWRHHNSYRPAVATEVESRLQRHFASHDEFSLTKSVLGVRFGT